ncbi:MULTISPECIES: DUF6750 family protein [Cronobacter]|uniref:DUF6750 family protein n=1 Tax=Cronobacter TaxID=413496 RepID=UPI000CFF9933|nr:MULTISPECIES: DUF6750 family protein [Cronobacter]EKM0439586.1 conjugal transfer protein [Cronobacter turicensis]WRU16721.1 DUF6750 family protein [Cronobacter malonaticus]
MLTRIYCAAFSRAIIVKENLRRLTLKALCAWLGFISPLAMADGDLADAFNAVANGAESGTKSALTIATFIGVVTVIASLIALKSMKNNPQVRPWMVAVGFLTGLLLIAVPEIIKRGQTQMNMSPVSVG